MKESEVFIFRIEICIVLRDVHWYYCPAFLTHFMPLISFPWKHQKTIGFLIFSRAVEKKQWHEIGQCYISTGVRTITPEENWPWLGIGFGLGLGLELGIGAIFLGGQSSSNHIDVFFQERSSHQSCSIKKGVSLKFRKIHRKKPVPGPHF